LPESRLVGVIDANEARATEIAGKYGVQSGTDYRDMLGKVDAVSIATPTLYHHEVAKCFLSEGVPVLVEKPITTTLPQAQELVALSREKGVALQVGHVERFNPAVQALLDDVRDPRFIEAHRLSPFRFRSIDIGVVLDLMIHDLDIILAVVNSDLVEIRAAGVNIISPHHEDIANARLTFENGCVANLTASRISQQPMRKMRFFTPECYATVDTQAREAYIYRKAENFRDFDATKVDPKKVDDPLYFVFNKIIDIRKVAIETEEPLKLELRSFLKCVRNGTDPVVPGEHGMRAIKVAFEILHTIDENLKEQRSGNGLDIPT
ncbi:MAG: Gfo/Idh/MocA family oxidoreductase, partial [Planctomycetota bacterium]